MHSHHARTYAKALLSVNTQIKMTKHLGDYVKQLNGETPYKNVMW